jgi:hypothetical protein
MTQEDKELLLKDLCARLDTNLVCSIYRIDDYGVGYRDEILSGYCKGDIWDEFYFGDDCGIGIDNVSKIKPYLFPLSSMTEEQKAELMELMYKVDTPFGAIFSENIDYFDWLNKNHFDYRGLIEKGLANDATNKNVY